MTSNGAYREAYVWIWLPGETTPVVAGKLSADGDNLIFNYGKSYLARSDAVAIYEPELPLQTGAIPLQAGLDMPACIRDASPDGWGRRVIVNRKLGHKGAQADTQNFDELTYLLESGSDRMGALDFQRSATTYEPREMGKATLEELVQAADLVEKGLPLSPELDQALRHGTSLGGARPKAQINDGDKKYIAKFSSTTDLYSLVKAEFIAMRLASRAGLNVASVSLTSSLNKDVLLIERFDRIHAAAGWRRKMMVSALTMLALDEMMARYASYEDLAEIIRHRFADARTTLRELYSRLVFNILCGNTDDHARNHAAFWDGRELTLTPAYDICPQGRTGNEASQAMLIAGENRMSRISSCLSAMRHFMLSREEAVAIVENQLSLIINHWHVVCDEAVLSVTDRAFLWGRQFLNPFAFEDLDGDVAHLKAIADKARAQ
ncbi:MAG: type II toxin-antitoxin system HipA family toxin [Proteobacteria bacterium]|nr:MAG: type II toxin-antitoxin system HipA family toxin [Pseudomonadota bacterium]QKK12616.1 MAG: type II toxin-antitoxin system HipA family toxin [Pseudomonadota bacterium]